MPPSNERPEDNSDKNNFEITSQLISEDEDYGSYKEVHQDEKEKINTFYLKKPRDEHL